MGEPAKARPIFKTFQEKLRIEKKGKEKD